MYNVWITFWAGDYGAVDKVMHRLSTLPLNYVIHSVIHILLNELINEFGRVGPRLYMTIDTGLNRLNTINVL